MASVEKELRIPGCFRRTCAWGDLVRLQVKNLLLDSLPSTVRAELLTQMEPVRLPVRSVLYKVDETPRYVHFLTSGIASVVTTMESGEAVETAMIGSEGFPEYLHLLGPQFCNMRCFMQVPGEALRMSFERFQCLFVRESHVLAAVHRLVQYQSLLLAQLGACNRLHDVEARLARWLMMVHDRTSERELRITQELLADTIGSRRSSVNMAAGVLQRSGAIDFSRGRVLVQNPEALRSVVCECYEVTRVLYRQFVANAARTT